MLVEEFFNLAFRQRPHKPVHRLPALKGKDGGNGLHLQLLRHRRMLINIHFGKPHRTIGLRRQFFQNRGQLLARAAPRGP